MGFERAGCFAYFAFLASRDGWAALPHDTMGLSAVCDCSISRSYSLTIFEMGKPVFWVCEQQRRRPA